MTNSITRQLNSLFSAYANHADAAIMEDYMKGIAPFFGIKTGQRRELLKHFWAVTPLPARSELQEVIASLFAQPQRELHYAALELLQKVRKQWQGDELALFEGLIMQKSWWDTVDTIATKLVAPFFLRFPDERDKTVARWIASDHMWLRRTAIIFQNPYKAKTDETLLFTSIRACAAEREFFIRKGIGWALREWAKTSPESVRQFVATEPLSPLSRREAMKHLGK